MKKKLLLTSILSIVMCVSLIAGATFALFTSESKVNVAVTSGKVDVVASIEKLKLYSAEAVSETEATNYREVTQFANGGTATFDKECNLTLDKMTPGDRATFTLNVANNSNVAAIYRTSISVSNDTGLYEALDITVDGATMTTGKTAWKKVDFDNKEYDVVIDLPAAATAQDVKCTLTFTVEAMQGNAVINDITAAELAKILTTPNANGVVELDKDYDVIDDWTSLTFSGDFYKQYTLNGNGNTITGLTMPLIGADASQNISISNLTISDSDIGSNTFDAKKGNNDYHSGAFVAKLDCGSKSLILDNCHTNNVNVTASDGSGSSAGSLVGYTALIGAADGLGVRSISITNCTVTGGSVKNAYGSAAGIIGLTQTNTYTDSENNTCSYKIENCKVDGCTIKGKAENKTGEIVATINGNGTLYINNCTYTGKAYGRIVNAQAIIDNVPYVTTLAQFTAAVNGSYEKVVLTADITNETLPMQGATHSYTYTLKRDLTIDLAGHTFTTAHRLFKLSKAKSSDAKGASLSIESSSENGKIYINKSSGNEVYGFVVDNGCTLNIKENVTIDMELSSRAGTQTIILNNGTVNMSGGKLIGRNTVVIASVMSAEGIFNMTGGEISIDARSTGIQQMYSGKVSLTKGSLTGNGVAYQNKGSTFDVAQDFIIADTLTIN